MKQIFTIALGLLLAHIGFSQSPLFIPDTLSGTAINLNLQAGTKQFFNGTVTNTYGANGNILGPTLILKKGDFVNFNVNNQLSDTTTIHWHGLHVAPENDGGPHTFILPNTTWSPSFTIMDKAATYWYHPHLHHKTNEHVSKGIAGLIIVKDNEEAALSLPRKYGVDDIPLVIQTKNFDTANQIMVHTNTDNVLMVNATIDAYVGLPAQVVRLRILNGASQRAFNLGLSGNQSFYQIASDGGLLSAPYQTTRLLLAPGERAEILVDLSGMQGQTIYLKSYASELPNGIFGAAFPGMGPGMSMTGYNPNPLNGTDFDILKINVTAQISGGVSTIPISLASIVPWNENNANQTRQLTFAPVAMGPNQLNGDFLINNTAYNMQTMNYTVPLNNIEIWELYNQSGIAHPFHIHDVQFNVLTRNGVAPPANEQGWKDVVLVKPQERVRFITKFEDFASNHVPYMYHCHLLTHEDGGMMGQFLVVNPNAIDEKEMLQLGIKVYPNPSLGSIRIDFQKQPNKIELIDVLGKQVITQMNFDNAGCTLDNLPKGIHFILLHFNEKILTRKIVVE